MKSAAVGRVREAGEPLEAPFSAVPCVFSEALVKHWQYGITGGGWVLLVRENQGSDLWIEDDTGRALVRTAGMKVLSGTVIQDMSQTFTPPNARQAAFLKRHGVAGKSGLFDKKLLYKETTFQRGDLVSVLGIARWEQDPDPDPAAWGYREAPRRLVIEPSDDVRVLASNAAQARH